MFGDGSTATSAADKSAEHSYRTAGTYTVRATVTRLHGPMTELSATVAVADTEAAIVVSNDHPARMEQVAFAFSRLEFRRRQRGAARDRPDAAGGTPV